MANLEVSLGRPESEILKETLLAWVDLVPAAQFGDVRPSLTLLQNANDLHLRETALPHPASPFAAKMGRLSHISTGLVFGEQISTSLNVLELKRI